MTERLAKLGLLAGCALMDGRAITHQTTLTLFTHLASRRNGSERAIDILWVKQAIFLSSHARCFVSRNGFDMAFERDDRGANTPL